jgi:hypothetical protein
MGTQGYKLTFDDGADGGPMHIIWKLEGFVFQFLKNGEVVVEGLLDRSFEAGCKQLVSVRKFHDETGDHTGQPVVLDIWADFDEVRYM